MTEIVLQPQQYESDDVMVSHPDHYQSESGLEVIDVIEAFTAELNGIMYSTQVVNVERCL